MCKSTKILLIMIGYYSILISILLSWNTPESTPPLPQRLIFLITIIIPLLKYPSLYPLVITSFAFIQSNMVVTAGYFPNKPIYILITTILFYFITRPKNKQTTDNIITNISYFVIYIFLVNIINLSEEYNGVITIILILFLYICNKNNPKAIQYFIQLFPIACIISCVYFFCNISEALYETESGNERAFINDPNITAINIGFGFILSVLYICKQFKFPQNKLLVILHAINIIISISAISTIASRGAFIAVCTAVILILHSLKLQIKTKFIVILTFIIIISFLMTLGFFETIIERLTDDDISSGNGRLDIWRVGFNRFFNHNIFTILFGGGDNYALEVCKKAILGYTGLTSPHNQFIWYTFDYGFIGASLFIIFIYNEILSSIVKRNPTYILIIYSIICFMSLPPISSSIIYPCFISFILYLNKKS